MEYIEQIAAGARAQAEKQRENEELQVKETAGIVRSTGKIPGKTCFCFWDQNRASQLMTLWINILKIDDFVNLFVWERNSFQTDDSVNKYFISDYKFIEILLYNYHMKGAWDGELWLQLKENVVSSAFFVILPQPAKSLSS